MKLIDIEWGLETIATNNMQEMDKMSSGDLLKDIKTLQNIITLCKFIANTKGN